MKHTIWITIVLSMAATAAAAPTRPLPRSPNLLQKVLQRRSPVRHIVRKARAAHAEQTTNEILNAYVERRGMTLNLDNAVKLAKATRGVFTRAKLLRRYADMHMNHLSFKDMRRIAEKMGSISYREELERDYAARFPERIQPGQMLRLVNRIGISSYRYAALRSYFIARQSSFTPSQRRRLLRAAHKLRTNGLTFLGSGGSSRSASTTAQTSTTLSTSNPAVGVGLGLTGLGVEPTLGNKGLGGISIGPSGNVYVGTGAGLGVKTGVDLW